MFITEISECYKLPVLSLVFSKQVYIICYGEEMFVFLKYSEWEKSCSKNNLMPFKKEFMLLYKILQYLFHTVKLPKK